MGQIVYDKKQLPQVILLGALSIGMFGFFSWRMFAPTPIQASQNPVAPKPGTPDPASVVAKLYVSQAPQPGMRDPFIPDTTIGAAPPPPPKTPTMHGRLASFTAPALHNVPSLGQIMPMPSMTQSPAQAALPPVATTPQWVVTGVVENPDNPTAKIAILRQGSERRFVRLGESVDGEFRLVEADHSGVTLRRNKESFRLPLGGAARARTNASAPSTMSPLGTAMPVSNPAQKLVPPTQPASSAVVPQTMPGRAVERTSNDIGDPGDGSIHHDVVPVSTADFAIAPETKTAGSVQEYTGDNSTPKAASDVQTTAAGGSVPSNDTPMISDANDSLAHAEEAGKTSGSDDANQFTDLGSKSDCSGAGSADAPISSVSGD